MIVEAQKYLKQQRQLNENTIKNFWVGYCDPNGFIYMPSSFPLTDLHLNDMFKNRVLFPICDLYGNIIGVSGRLLNDGDPKYYNTEYDKAKHLYGFNVTLPICFEERKVYIVEGNIDVLSVYQRGIKNVVGMLGSNLTVVQLCLLSRFVDKVVFVPDGDIAGEKFLNRTKKLIEKYNSFGLQYFSIKLPNGYDPDKFLIERGKDSFVQLEQPLILSLSEQLESI